MKKLSLKPFTLIAGILTCIAGLNDLLSCIVNFLNYEYIDIPDIIQWHIIPGLTYLSLSLFFIVLYSKQK